ncbi:MAG: DNA-binding protein [Elusimicrobia bacterium CG03_land_8_20_14_0_80_50_18]|nr:MAG: DNA-binding protein [Elusimicrobia bacterium CG03_land_8_20_14_0_80_50_18]PIX14296.1 MAG: DNA-binding protein [Elusimicrobia bacterium CG_4_8_14_3_um_filter_50_9]
MRKNGAEIGKNRTNYSPVKFEDVAGRVIEVRGEKVILDSEVAELYGVETREINQAVKNNPEKFPDEYIFTLSKGEKQEVIKNFDNLAKVKFFPQLPKAFTEKGLYMLATILKSPKAVRTTIAIIETFAKLRKLTRNIKELSVTKDKDAQKSLMREGGGLAAEMLDGGLGTIGSETSVEVNFAVLKLKHIVKKGKRK